VAARSREGCTRTHTSPHMKAVAISSAVLCGLLMTPSIAAQPDGSSPRDFAYRMQVTGTANAAAYSVTLPLALYQKIAHADLADVRVFNASGEQVPFAIERAVAGTVLSAATALPLFPLRADSSATPDALRVTIESGKSAINVQAVGQGSAT